MVTFWDGLLINILYNICGLFCTSLEHIVGEDKCIFGAILVRVMGAIGDGKLWGKDLTILMGNFSEGAGLLVRSSNSIPLFTQYCMLSW